MLQTDLEKSFLHLDSEDKVPIMMTTLENGRINWSEIFLEPEFGEFYELKLLPNITGKRIEHRRIYKGLPDPKRKGKTFTYISSGDGYTCPVLQTFFTLNDLKNKGDALATLKIDNYFKSSSQGCVVVQILKAPNEKKELVGQFRLLVFSTAGENAHIAQLINNKMNPDKKLLEVNPNIMEDVFNICESKTLLLTCEKKIYGNDKREGRSFAKSQWTPDTKKGVTVTFEDESTYTFSKEDMVTDDNGTPMLREQAKPAMKRLIELLSDEKLSVHNYFSYKKIGDPQNSKQAEKHLVDTIEKINEICPVIINAKSISEIMNYGVAEQISGNSTIISQNTRENILKDSIPTELNNIITQDNGINPVSAPSPTSNIKSGDDEVNDILAGKK